MPLLVADGLLACCGVQQWQGHRRQRQGGEHACQDPTGLWATVPGMYETKAELQALQALMDTSLQRSSPHLRSIVTPGRTTLTAPQLVRVLTGMCTLAVATVTARGEPRISGIDGHFLHGRWIMGTDRSAAKARHLAARPAVSVAHLRGEALGVFTHGTAEVLHPTEGAAHPAWPAILDHLTRHYGQSPLGFGDDVIYYRVQPHWMVAYASEPNRLLAATSSSEHDSSPP
jgi:Pyridoxamine 5'-phosphate oxidase